MLQHQEQQQISGVQQLMEMAALQQNSSRAPTRYILCRLALLPLIRASA